MKKSAIILLILLFSGTTNIYANYADTYGFSSWGIARGNAVTATVNNWSSVYYNMAGLGKTDPMKKENTVSEQPRSSLKKRTLSKNNIQESSRESSNNQYSDQFAISYMYTYPMMEILSTKSVPGDDNLNFGTITIGLILDLNHFIKMPKDIISTARFGLGMGVMQDGSLVKVNDVDLRAHNFMRYGREAQRAVILAGIGFGFLNDMFGIGVGANIWTKGEGKVEMTNLELSSGTQIPTQQVVMDLKPAIAPSGGLYFSPGKIFPVVKGLEVGFNYRGELYMDLPLETNADMILAGIELKLGLYILDYFTPHTFNAGIAYTLIPILPNLTISIDFEYQMWSRFKVSKAKEVFIEKYNANNSVGDPDISMPDIKDVMVPKIGISYKVLSWLNISMGYFFRTSFLPDNANNTEFNFLDNTTHVGSFGLGFIIPKMGPMVSPIEINLTGQFQYLIPKAVAKDAEFVSDLNPHYTYSGMVPSGMLEIIMRW